MIRVGPAGWSYADWEGRVYPRPKPADFHPLAYLARYFQCVELNSSFYAHPNPRHAERWVELVDDLPSFRFTAKLQQLFTHGPHDVSADTRSRWTDEARVFRSGLAPLERSGKLAALLVQFPFGFRAAPPSWRRLEHVRELFDRERLVLEVRHASWFEPAAFDTVTSLGFDLALIDMPSGPDQAPRDFELPAATSIGYLRLHGRNREAWFDRRAGRDQKYDYLYTRAEIQDVVARVKRLASGVDETYVVTNNHFGGQAVANALEIESALSGSPPLAPPALVDSFPHLRDLTRVDGQGTLF